MMPERIHDATDTPAVRLISNGPDNVSSRSDGASERSVGILDNEDHTRGGAAQGFGAKVLVLG